jgi:hypothetical protein
MTGILPQECGPGRDRDHAVHKPKNPDSTDGIDELFAPGLALSFSPATPGLSLLIEAAALPPRRPLLFLQVM